MSLSTFSIFLEKSQGSIKRKNIKEVKNNEITFLYDLNYSKFSCITSLLDSLYWVKIADDDLFKSVWFKYLDCKPISKQGDNEPFPVYYNHPLKFIGVPKFFGLSLFGKPKKDNRSFGLPIDENKFKFLETFVLRDYQKLCIEKTINQLKEWGGATIIADCGAGKTAMSLNIASVLKKKTLVICNRVFLMEQWKHEINTLLPCLEIGWMQGNDNEKNKKYDIHKDIVIASIETLSRCEHKKNDLDSFGFIIIDEMHHLAAKTLSQVLSKFSCGNILGVTATPERNDGLEHLLYWLVGPVSFVYKRCPEITGKKNEVEIIKKNFNGYVICNEILNNLSFTRIMKLLSNNEHRNEFISNEILKLSQIRNKILIATVFIKHGNQLLNLLLQNKEFENKCVFLHGGCKQESIVFAKSQNCKIVFATYQYMEEGYDDCTLDSLILSMPRSKVQQVIGRCERSFIGKLNPIIIDIVDSSFPICQGMYKKRMKFYKERSYQLQ